MIKSNQVLCLDLNFKIMNEAQTKYDLIDPAEYIEALKRKHGLYFVE